MMCRDHPINSCVSGPALDIFLKNKVFTLAAQLIFFFKKKIKHMEAIKI